MVYLIFLIVSFGASIAGAICGIGGGVIIKPALDAVGVLDVATISFLSGCTVLTMSCYSVYKAKRSGESLIDMKIGTPLAIGAAVGGVVGKWMFQMVSSVFADKNMVGAVQAACLLVITLGTLIYTIYKEKIHTKHLVNFVVCLLVGLVLFLLHGHQGGGTEFPLHHSVLSDHQLFTDGSDRKSASFPDHGSGDHGIWRTDGRLLWTNY